MSASAPPVASVGGLFETHLTVQDIARSIAFYRDVLGLSLAYELPDGQGAFFWTGGTGQGMLGLWPAGPAPFSLAPTSPSPFHSRTSCARPTVSEHAV